MHVNGRQFDRCYWPTCWRQPNSSDVTSDVSRTEERAPKAVSASDDASDDHTGALRFTDTGSENTQHTHIYTVSHKKQDAMLSQR